MDSVSFARISPSYATKLPVIVVAFCIAFIIHPSASHANWLHFGYDAQYTSFNPSETLINQENVSQLRRRWGIGCDDGFFSVIFRSPAIYEGKLYTSGAGDRLTSYNALDGATLWKFGNGNAGWAPQPTVAEDGTVFYMEQTNPTYLYAVNANGEELWEAPIGFELGFSGAAEALVTVDEANDCVYVIEAPFIGYGKLFALSKKTGEILWYKSKQTDDVGFKGNYVLLKANKIFVPAEVPMEEYPSEGDHMLRIDALTQDIEVTYSRPEPENYYDINAYTLCNDKLLVGFDYQYDPVKLLVAYNPDAPSIVWQKDFSEITGKIACNTQTNVIYVPTDPYLYALDAATGQEIWKYQGYAAIYNPSVANGVVYFISDTNMYAIDENTGKKLFSYPLGYSGDTTTQVAISDGMLFFSGNGGTCDLFALGLEEGSEFDDVPPSFWAYGYIKKLFDAKITQGCGHGNYCPEDTVTRAQMAVFLERGINGSEFVPPTASGIFDDVPLGYWARNWIEQFYEDGITKGCNESPLMYCPDQPVTRAEMAIFLLRAKYRSSHLPPTASGVFSDVSPDYWAADWVEQLYAEGITTGCSESPLKFCPDASVTRAQMAAFLVRTFGLE